MLHQVAIFATAGGRLSFAIRDDRLYIGLIVRTLLGRGRLRGTGLPPPVGKGRLVRIPRNLLLSALALPDRDAIGEMLDPVVFTRGEVLIEPNVPITHAWFPSNGIVSVIAISPEANIAEVGVVGRDGLAGVALLLGADRSPMRTVVQIEGVGHRIAAVDLAALNDARPALRLVLQRYVHSFMLQASYTALSNANHSVEERLARWLLMCQDRHGEEALPLTHEFLSIMLVVRRPSVTTALHMLEGAGMIRATRGRILIRDRAALEDFARDAYGVPEAHYERLIAPLREAA